MSSCRQFANAATRPNSWSAALSNTAPPSELPCDWSNLATTGRSKIPRKRTHCVRTRKPPDCSQNRLRQRLCTMKEAFRVSKTRIIQANHATLSQRRLGIETARTMIRGSLALYSAGSRATPNAPSNLALREPPVNSISSIAASKAWGLRTLSPPL